MKELCVYGCGHEGIFKLKNGNVCCHKSPNQCPSIKKKNSEKAKKRTHKFVINANEIKKRCKWCNEEKTAPTINRHEKSCYLNPLNKILCPICNKPIKDYKNNKTCSHACARKYFSDMYLKFSMKPWNNCNPHYRRICFKHHKKECIICGEKNIVEVHHYDGNHKNDDPINLIPLCSTHHKYIGSQFEYLIIDKVNEYHNEYRNKIYNNLKS